jgi:hypothetical protein
MAAAMRMTWGYVKRGGGASGNGGGGTANDMGVCET